MQLLPNTNVEPQADSLNLLWERNSLKEAPRSFLASEMNSLALKPALATADWREWSRPQRNFLTASLGSFKPNSTQWIAAAHTTLWQRTLPPDL